MMQTIWRGPPFRDRFSGQQGIHGANLWGSSEGQQVSEDGESRLAATAVMTTPGKKSGSKTGKTWKQHPLSALGEKRSTEKKG